MNAITLVTGGTGFFGSHLVELLRRRGERVRVLTRASTPALSRSGVEIIEGSIHEEETIREALGGVSHVYHAAGLVARDPGAASDMFRLHVDATRLLLEQARKADVKRLLLVSTSGTIAVTEKEAISSEEAPYRIETVRRWPYYLSKIFQEKLALEMAEAGGPEVVVINPSLLLGPGDHRISSTGDVLRFLRKEIPIIPSGGLSFVDARDAAAGAILAMERGRPSRRYLISGPNWTMAEFFERLSRSSGIRGPSLRVPDKVAGVAARFLEEAHRLSRSKKAPPVDAASVEMARHFWYCDASRARSELGWEPRDPMETVGDTIAFLQERFFGGPPSPPRPSSYLEGLLALRPDGDPDGAPAAKKSSPRGGEQGKAS